MDQPNGLAYNHAFTVLGPKLLSNGAKLIKIRNPWGAETYKGDYSDKSAKWTPALRAEAGSTIANDGEFFIPLASYMTSFYETHINLNVDKMSRAHYLILDDPSAETRQTDECKGTCSYHKLTLKSSKT